MARGRCATASALAPRQPERGRCAIGPERASIKASAGRWSGALRRLETALNVKDHSSQRGGWSFARADLMDHRRESDGDAPVGMKRRRGGCQREGVLPQEPVGDAEVRELRGAVAGRRVVIRRSQAPPVAVTRPPVQGAACPKATGGLVAVSVGGSASTLKPPTRIA